MQHVRPEIHLAERIAPGLVLSGKVALQNEVAVAGNGDRMHAPDAFFGNKLVGPLGHIGRKAGLGQRDALPCERRRGARNVGHGEGAVPASNVRRSSEGIETALRIGLRDYGPATSSSPDLHRLDDALGHFLGVAEQHHGVVAVEQRVVDTGIA